MTDHDSTDHDTTVPAEGDRRAAGEQRASDDRPSLSPPRGAAAAPDEDARARRRRLALASALLLGVLLRLAQYAVNRSLWMDEALLAQNILPRSWAGLLRPLDRGQTAPFGFLALEKAMAGLLGPGEYALRLVPVAAGLATLLLLPRVARRYVTRPALPIAVAIVAIAPFLVYYSSELKQYAVDALATVLILAVAARALRGTGRGPTAALLAATGAVLVWFSQPSILVLAGVGLVLLARAVRRGDRREAVRLAAAGALWCASFAGSYLVSLHEIADPAYMRAFWETGFLPLVPRKPADWTWLPRMLARVFREPLGVMGHDGTPMSAVAAAATALCFAAGCAWMARHRPRRLALLLAPLGVALCASAARAYPFGGDVLSGGRVLIYAVPLLACVVAEGAVSLARLAPGRGGRAARAAAVALVLLPGAAYAALNVPHLRNEVKPLLEYAAAERRPGDVMYVYYAALPAAEYYGPRYGWTGDRVVRGICARRVPERYLQDLARLRGRARVWVLMVEAGPRPDKFEEEALMVRFLDYLGRRLDARFTPGAAVYLYDLRPGTGQPGGFTAQVPHAALPPEWDCRGAWAPLPGVDRDG